jgi:hypothetical protein
MLSLETTIEYLLQKGLIPGRLAVACIKELNIRKLGEVLDVRPAKLMECKNVGSVTLHDLERFKKRYAYLRSRDVEERTFFDTNPTETLYPVLAASFKSVVKDPEVERCFLECYGAEFEYILSHWGSSEELLLKPNYDEATNEAVRTLLVDVLTAAAEREETEPNDKDRIVAVISSLKKFLDYLEAVRRFKKLPLRVRRLLQLRVSAMFDQLSVRCRNALGEYEKLNVLVESIIEKEELSPGLFHNCGKKTFDEFKEFYAEFQECYSSVIAFVYEGGTEDVIKELWAKQVGKEYPFLWQEECAFLSRYVMDAKEIPALYILYRYITRVDSSQNKVFRYYFGLEADGVQHTLSETAKKMNLTSERVRQITSSKIFVKGNLAELVESVASRFRGDIIPDTDSVWASLKRYNRLKMEKNNLMSWMSSFSDTYRFLEIKENQRMYLVRKELVENVRVGMFVSEVKRIAGKIRTKDEVLDVKAVFLEVNELQEVNKDKEILFPVYMECFRSFPNTEIVDKFHIRMKANKLDRFQAIESILLKNNAPMYFEEIWHAYNAMYPDDAFVEETQLRSYIFRSPNILSKGKTGIYVHKDWEGQYTGSLTNYLYHILDSVDVPVSCSELYARAIEQYPNTSEKSIHALMMGDMKKRFMALEDGMYCLVGKEYGCEIKERKIVRRQMSDRVSDLEHFIVKHKRFPVLSGSEEEISLARWESNISKGTVQLPLADSERFNTLLKRFKDYPHTALEKRFKMACDSIKSIVRKTSAMPTLADSAYEFNWFKKNLKLYSEFKDNRKMYFEDLLLFLHDYGFVFSVIN